MDKLTHITADGAAQMVDVSAKPSVPREAVAQAFICLQPHTLDKISSGQMPKGEVLAVARLAGIQAAKLTSQLIPLCHQIPLSKVSVDFKIEMTGIRITTLAKTTAPTGVEMEALTAVSVAALTIYDMCKAIDKTMIIQDVTLLSKTKADPPTNQTA
jgi:cyclic pyranopterin monophosphate synthase